MLESFNNKFEYTKLSEQEMKERGILGRLVGPIADTQHPTRNGRRYPKKLWENVFNDPLVQEKINNRCFFGELDHPSDRDETCSEKVAVCLAEPPKEGKDGMLYGIFDILPTPNGKILKAFCDYGTTVGISSRGTGDIVYDDNGDEVVDESTYDCQGFDIVLVPAMEQARLNYVTESLDKKNNGLRRALTESLNNSSDEDKEAMKDTLNHLGINLDEKKTLNEDVNTSNSANIKVDSKKEETDKTLAVKDNEAKQLVSSLQESLKSKVLLETKVQKLQEDLAVSDTKVKQLQEELNKYKGLVVNMTKYASENKDLKKDIVSLEEKLASQEKTITLQEKRIGTLVDKIHLKETKAKDLRENYNSTSNEVKSLQEKLASSEVAHKNEIKQLKEQLKETNANLEIKENELSTKLAKASKLIEKYKGFVNTTVDRYIESKAVMLGVTPNEIKNRLSESYTLDEVDKVCESLQDFNLRISKLPFNVEKGTRIGITESKKSRYEEVSAEEDISNLAKFIKEN